jgi:REP element-mobilizing transposase RayT
MPQSLSYLLTHIVFSTKDRAPVLDAAVRPALHAYLATVARNADCECFRVGGVADHVHRRTTLRPQGKVKTGKYFPLVRFVFISLRLWQDWLL